MARAKPYTLSSVLWGDINLEATLFADRQAPHRTPQASDPDWNSLVNDYVSLSTALNQILQASADVVGLQHQDYTTPTKNMEEWLNAAGVRIAAIGTRNNLNVGGPGINIYPTADSDNTTGIWFMKKSTGSVIKIFSYLGIASQMQLGTANNDLIYLGRDLLWNGRNIIMSGSWAGGFADWRSSNLNLMPHRHFTVDTLTNVPNGDMATGMIRVNPGGGPLTVDQLETFDAATAAVVAIMDSDHSSFVQSLTPPAIAIGGSPGTVGNTFSSSDHTHSPTPGTVISLDEDYSQVSNTVPNADTNQKTFALGANSYTRIRTRAEGYVTTTATSTLQDINLKIKYGGTQIGVTMIYHSESALAGSVPFHVEASAAQAGAATVAVTAGAATADANTTVKTNKLVVEGIV